ncbi:oxygen-insensitive NAD(P)H-dependent nitroreductase NfsB [Balneatrix alpica]|uniref:Oxygen-insensitive NAD(P)H-dependent nitroreductase NfsB n=1 Tax=Balneatrix alpica TaxID=75684 RepID=A0ABV5ZFJ1_9GAMM|nr:oxygen-insensitive NAD(P)H-dependent nitroreductase NfsB [Balneatrix alpica]
MNLTDIALSRYSTKAFDPARKISAEQVEQLQSLLRLSPSSVNSQPWHFVIASSEAGKARVAKGTQGFFQFNEAKVLNASHVVVFCAKTEISDEYLQHLLDSEEQAGRFAEPSHKEMVRGARATFVNIHRHDLKDAQHWMEKQVYLNMGTLLLGAAALGIDALPMEGIDMKALDTEFGLREQGFTAIAVVALGYRAEQDFNATLAKARLPAAEIFTQI